MPPPENSPLLDAYIRLEDALSDGRRVIAEFEEAIAQREALRDRHRQVENAFVNEASRTIDLVDSSMPVV